MNKDLDKDKMIRRAFWSTDLTYKQWKRKLKSAKPSSFILVDACSHLPFSFLYKEMGDQFFKLWPEIRTHLLGLGDAVEVNKDSLDANWAVKMTSDAQFPIDPAIVALPKKKREVHWYIVRDPSITAYELAKLLNRDYSAIHRDVKYLIDQKLVEARKGVNSRNIHVQRLFSTISINTKLFDQEVSNNEKDKRIYSDLKRSLEEAIEIKNGRVIDQ
jgi:predicted transcriptional regulator